MNKSHIESLRGRPGGGGATWIFYLGVCVDRLTKVPILLDISALKHTHNAGMFFTPLYMYMDYFDLSIA